MTPQRSFDLGPLIRAAADDLQCRISGEHRWVTVGPEELRGLTAADRDLIHVVTGERIPAGTPWEAVDATPAETTVSFFTLQIAADRLVGPLRDGGEVPIAYVEDLYTAHEDDRAGTPVCGDLLDLALAYLAGRELALLGPDLS